MSHTPGPWKVSNEVGHRRNPIIEEDGTGEFYNYICEVYWTTGWGGDANARLIAASPELLDACKEAADYLAGKNWDKVISDEVEAKLRAAIAKAKGQS